jgi:2',3'-cyclic-nucleotide 2'-phosphodiesterase / 3'-nucleotidase
MRFRKLMMMAAGAAAVIGCSSLKDGEYNLTVVSTGDGHGNWFAAPVEDGGKVRGSLMAQSRLVSGIRGEKGEDNVILVDAGDNFWGNGAPFYYNFIDTVSSHLYPRLAAYMKYDAVVAGHSDFESGHRVYDRVAAGMKKAGVPFLAGNAFAGPSGKPYFPACTIVKKGGVKVAILGYTNAGTASLVDASSVSGVTFRSLLPLVQEDVDKVRSKEKPQVVIVVAHTAMGKGDGCDEEKQGLDLFKSLRGVDLLVAGHDHMFKTVAADSIIVIDSGKGGQNAGVADIRIAVKGGKVVGKTLSGKVVSLKADEYDASMAEAFSQDYEAVRGFVNSPVGEVAKTMVSREFYWGQCDYLNFLHALSLSCPQVEVSLTATLLIDGEIPAGEVLYGDVRKLYPYENKLVVIRLTGKEIKDYLEASYDAWINTVEAPSEDSHVLKIKQTKDYANGGLCWKLAKSPANFDSAAGINYTVDVTKPRGSRVSISSMADGSAFDPDREYRVAVTSYRATGSGGLLQAAGLDTAEAMESRIIFKGPEFRTILYEYLKSHRSLDPAVFGDPKTIGVWKFIPKFASDEIRQDVELVYGPYAGQQGR